MSLMIAAPRCAVNSSVPTEAEDALADRLAWAADGGDEEAYPGPEWREDYLPTPKEEAEEAGYQIGLTGERPGFNEVFAGDPGAATDGRGLAFTTGRNRGLREHAERVEREREMAAYFLSLDHEREIDERERDMEIMAREAGGWDRLIGREME